MKDEVSDLRERTKAFALRVIKMFTALPKTGEARVLGRQVLRSGTSVGANYRDSSGMRKPAESSPQGACGGVRQPQRGRSKPEFIAKIGDCLKELDESAYWLELLVDSGIVQPEKLAPLRDECEQLLAIFTTISKKSKSSPS